MPSEPVDYLSDDWIDAAAELLASVVLDPPHDGPPFSVETAITDAPPGRSGYVVEVDGATVAARRVTSDRPSTIRLSQPYSTAAAVASGTTSAQAAFLAADIGLGGDVAQLIAHAGLISRIGDVLAPLRARTRYEVG